MRTGLIFDMDGTLWDAVESIATAWSIEAKRSENIVKAITVEELNQYMGKTMDKFVGLFPNLPIERAVALIGRCEQYELEYLLMHPGKMYPMVRETLEALGKDYDLYIVSNCGIGYIETFMKCYDMNKYFLDFENYGQTQLPKAESIRILMERNKIESAIYVGDTLGDYEAATKAGIPFILAAYGFGEVPCAKWSVNSFQELQVEVLKVQL